MDTVNFGFPTDIRLGVGAVKSIPSLLKERGYKRPLLLADSGIAALPFFSEIRKDLEAAGHSVSEYHDFLGNPVEKDVMAGVDVIRNHKADSMVMVGGGAAMDVGKAVALMAYHSGSLFDYEDVPGAKEATEEIPFMVAVPTTAGTGSEVGRSSVISENESKAKKIIFSPRLLPPLVIMDPELTVGLPKDVTATTGMDALTHLVESYLAKGYHPMCDGIALQGIQLIDNSLVKVYENPKDLEARGHMLVAAMMGAVAFQKGLGVTHSCAHALSTVFDLHHGLANALMLEACLAFNREVATKQIAAMSRMVGVLDRDENKACDGFISWVRQLRISLGLKQGLASYGVSITDRLLDVAMADVCHPLGPKAVTRSDFQKLFQEAL